MKRPRKIWIQLLSVPGIIAAVSPAGYATVYLSVEEAQQAIFPGETFTPLPIQLTEAQASDIKKKSGVKVRVKEPKIWKTSAGGFFIVDEVLGKHEFIVYAVGILSDGSVHQIEIMDYRETYGYQIREKNWRDQFSGKNTASPLKLNEDIKNITGATLSCKHVADGVKRLLAMYEIALR